MPQKLLEPRWREREGPVARDTCRIGTRAAYQSEGRRGVSLSLFFLFFSSSSIATHRQYGLYKDSLRGAHGALTLLGWPFQLSNSPSTGPAENHHDIILRALTTDLIYHRPFRPGLNLSFICRGSHIPANGLL